MIETQLSQYGVFGLWTLTNLFLIKWLLVKLDKRELELREVINNNTKALTLFLDKIKK